MDLPGEYHARIGVVLGSGLGDALRRLLVRQSCDYGSVAGIPVPAVAGHGGRFLALDIAGTRVLVASGRVHLYEGHTAQAVGSIVRAMAAAGVRILLLTNAAGSLHPEWPVGTCMRITDHLNLTGTSPLEGTSQFLDMSAAYDAALAEAMDKAAQITGMELVQGVYAGLRGPQYESPAEVRMLQALGADAVGMSTVLECLQARALGLRVAGLSLLTNAAAGLGSGGLDHREVVDAGRAASAVFAAWFAAWVADVSCTR